jgi:hypothetical protein
MALLSLPSILYGFGVVELLFKSYFMAYDEATG